MKKKVWISFVLLLLMLASYFWLYTSFSVIQKKLNLETAAQSVMVLKTDAANGKQESSFDRPAAINASAPVLSLKTKQVVLEQGDNFGKEELMELIQNLSDDHDTRQSLYENVKITGKYHTDKPGEYELLFTVTDSDGYTSDPQKLKMIVKTKQE